MRFRLCWLFVSVFLAPLLVWPRTAQAGPAQAPATAAPDGANVDQRSGPAEPAPAHEAGADEEKAARTETPSAAEQVVNELWSKVKIGTLWYLNFATGQESGESYNRAHVGRGYVTLKFEPVKWFQSRVTLDTHQDDSGDWKVRLKYLYGKFVVPAQTAVLTDPNVELGIVHGPWFDYEEHVNHYRAEGTMFIERNKGLNSAGVGATAGGLIGPKLSKDYQKNVSKYYPGKYGSFAFGLYNGGGYHAAEENENKVFMSRLSLRPLGFVLPHWQVSYFFIHGKGNTADEPTWKLHALMTSIEHDYFVVTGQLALGEGNQKGDKVDDAGDSLDFFGYSAFAELRLPWIMSSLIGRYDYFDWGTNGGESPTRRVIAGHAVHFLPHNFLLASLDHVTHTDPGIPRDRQVKLTLQVHYP